MARQRHADDITEFLRHGSRTTDAGPIQDPDRPRIPARPDEHGVDGPRSAAMPRRTPDETLGRHLLGAVMSDAQAQRFRDAPGLRVVIEAPTPAWVEPLRRAAASMADWHLAEGIDGRPRETGTGASRIARVLDAGRRVVVVSHAPGRLVPPSLVARADMTIRTGPPTPAVIRQAIRDATGAEPGITSERLGDRLDFFDLVAAIEAGSDLRTCLRRLGSASANRAAVDRFPAGHIDLSSQPMDGEAVTWARRLVADVDAWRQGETAGFSPPDRHAVFCGPRGTGKSGLVAAIARSADLPLISTCVPAWFTDGSPFVDEIDAVPSRSTLDSRNRDYWTPLVSHILLSLDSAVSGTNGSLIVVGATNFPERLDQALVRPGRLDRIVRIERPDQAAIAGILRQHLGDDLPGEDLEPLRPSASGPRVPRSRAGPGAPAWPPGRQAAK
jgi:hypothetical protein